MPAILISAMKNWKLIGMGLMLVVCGLLWLGKASAERQAAKFQQALIEANAKIEFQNAAVDRLKEEGERRQKAAQNALSEAREASKVSEASAKRIEAPRALSGRCETPREIMEAGL